MRKNGSKAGSVRSRYFLADNLKTRKRIRAEGGTDRHVDCVASTANQDAANSRDVVPRVKGKPLAPQERLEPAGEIHFFKGRGHANVSQVSCAVPRGNI